MSEPLYQMMPLAGQGQQQAQPVIQDGAILRPIAGQAGTEAAGLSGNPVWDEYLMELPEEDRPAALQRLMAPLTGEEVWKKRQANKDYVPAFDEFLRMWEYRRTLDSDVMASIAGGLGMFANVFGEAISHTAQNPITVGQKAIPSLIEAFWQGSHDMYGMVAEAEDPASAMFRFKALVTGNGSDEEKYQQYLQALQFQRRSERLFNGEETLLMDKDLIDEKFTRAAAFVVDPATFVPFGGLAIKGARAVGLGEAMIKASVRAQAIKTAVYGGVIKVGVGVPLDFIGGATRNTIEKGAHIAARGLDEIVGVPYEESARMARTVGLGTASAHVAGYSIPYAGTAAAAWAGGGLAESIGQAVKAVSDKYIINRGERGVRSFAREVLEDSKAMHPNMQLSKGTQNVLRIMDKMDPFLSYGAEVAESAFGGAMVGGGLGYLSAQGEGFGMGFGTGLGLGASGALVNRGISDVAGVTRNVREGVQAHFMLETIKESKPETYKSWNAILAHPSLTPELRRIINRQIVGVHSTVDNVNVHAHWTADEFNARVREIESPSAQEAGQQSNVSATDFLRSDAFTIARKNNGQVDIFVNMENIFKPSKKYSGLTMAHEFGHALFMHNVLGPHFSAVFRDKMLGVRDANGVLVEGPEIPFSDIKDFLGLYNNIRNVWSRIPIKDEQGRPRVDYEQKKLWDSAIEKLANEKVGETTKLTREEMEALQLAVEEFGMYNFGAWMNEKPMEFFLNGGELEGVQGLIDSTRNYFADLMESRINPHEPKFRYHQVGRGMEVEHGNFDRKGRRIRTGVLDYFFTDMIRAASQIKNRGYLDLNKASTGYLDTLYNKGLSEVLVRDPKTKKVRVMTQKEFDANNAARGAEIFRVLDSMTDQDSAGGMTKDLDGNYIGKFNEAQLRALEVAGLFTPEETSKIRMFQRADLAERGTVPNEFNVQYFGKSMGVSRWDDNERVRGNRVAFKNRTFILGHTDFKFGADGTYRLNVRALDSNVIQMRAKEVWLDPNARSLWDNDFQAMLADFYEKYLPNLSKPPEDSTRMASADVLGDNGALKRNILHNIAGFAKALDLPYANTPYSSVSRGTMSAVMDLSLGRMVGLRTTGMSYKYDHKNAFWDVSRNYKLDTSQFQKTPTPQSTPERPLFRWDGIGIPTWGDDKNNAAFLVQITEKPVGATGKEFEVSGSYEFNGNATELKGTFKTVAEAQKYLDEFYFDRGMEDGLGSFRKDANDAILYKEVIMSRFGEKRTEPLNTEIKDIVEQSKQYGSLAEVPKIKQKLQKLGIRTENVHEVSMLEELGKIVENIPDPRLRKLAVLKYLGIQFDANGELVMRGPSQNKAFEAIKRGNSPAALVAFVSNLNSGILNKEKTGNITTRFKSSKDRLRYETSKPAKPFATKATINGKEVQMASAHANPARAHRHALETDNVSAGTISRIPSAMTMIGGRKPIVIFQKAKHANGRTDANPRGYLQNINSAIKAGHDLLIPISEKKLLDALDNASFDWEDMLDAIEYVTLPNNIEDVVIADVGQSQEVMGSRVGVDGDDIKVTSGARQFSESSRLLPTRNAEQMRNAADIITIKTNAWLNKGVARTGVPMFKLDTEFNYIANEVRNELRKPEVQALIDHVDHFIVANTVPTEAIWDAYLKTQAAGDAAVLSMPLPLTETEFLANIGEQLLRYRTEYAEYSFQHRMHYWTAEQMSEFRNVFLHLGKDTNTSLAQAEFIYEPVMITDVRNALREFYINDEANFENHLAYGVAHVAFTESHRQWLSRTSSELIAITDDYERRLDETASSNTWERTMKEILQRNNVDDASKLTDIDEIKEYQQNAGRVVAARSLVDPKNIEQLKATLERETNGFLSAEVILRPNGGAPLRTGEKLQKTYEAIDALTPEQRQAYFEGNWEAAVQVGIKPRVTITWGPKALEMREFVRGYTGQKWRASERIAEGAINIEDARLFSFKKDNANTAIRERIQNDPAFVEQVRQQTQFFTDATGAYDEAFKNHKEKQSEYERKVRDLNEVKTYEDYLRDMTEQQDRVREKAETEKAIETLGNGIKDRDEATAGYLRRAYIRRKMWENSAEAIRALIANDATDAVYKHFLHHYVAISQHPEKYNPNDVDVVMRVNVYDPEGKHLDGGDLLMSEELQNHLSLVHQTGREGFKNVEYKDTFGANLPRAVRAVLAATPNGISAKNLLKELEKMHSQGTKVKDEMRYTGFLRWLDEQSKKPKVNGKDPKLDPVETLSFVDSTQMGVMVQKNPRLNIDTYRGGLGSYHSGDGNSDYGIISVHAKSPYNPSNRSQHVTKGGDRDASTIAHSRFTVREGSDGFKHVQIEENQANNQAEPSALAGEAVGSIMALQSPVIRDVISKAIADTNAAFAEDTPITAKSLKDVMQAMGLNKWIEDYGDSKDLRWRAGAGVLDVNTFTETLTAAGNITIGKSSKMLADLGRTDWNKAEKYFARKYLESVATTLVEVGKVTKNSAQYAKSHVGDYHYEVMTNMPTDAIFLMRYGTYDPMSTTFSKVTGSGKYTNAELYHFKFSQEGTAAAMRFFEAGSVGSRFGGHAASSWLQGQIASVFSPEVLNKVYAEVYDHIKREIEQKIDLYGLEDYEIGNIPIKAKGIDAAFIKAMRKHAPKIANRSVARSVTETLFRRNLENNGFLQPSLPPVDIRAEVDAMMSQSLTVDDIIAVAPAFLTKNVISGSNQVSNYESLQNSNGWLPDGDVAVKHGSYWAQVYSQRSASLGDTQTGLGSLLGHIALNEKVGTHVTNVARRMLDFNNPADIFVNKNPKEDWDRLSKSTRKAEWDGNGVREYNGEVTINTRILQDLLKATYFSTSGVSNMERANAFSMYTNLRSGLFDRHSEDMTSVGNSDMHIGMPFAPNYGEAVRANNAGEILVNRIFTSKGEMFKEWSSNVSGTPTRSTATNWGKNLLYFGKYLVARAAERGESFGLIDNSYRHIAGRVHSDDGRIPAVAYFEKLKRLHGDMGVLKRVADTAKDVEVATPSSYPDADRLIEFIKDKVFSEGMDVTAMPKQEVMLRSSAAKLFEAVTHNKGMYERYVSDDVRSALDQALSLTKNSQGKPKDAIVNELQNALAEAAGQIGVNYKGSKGSVNEFIVSSGLKPNANSDDLRNLPLAEKIKILQSLSEFPHLDTGEWAKLLAISMFKTAYKKGADFLTLQHPHEAGTVSGLDGNKADQIYGNILAQRYIQVGKDNAIPKVPRISADMNPDNPNFKFLKDDMEAALPLLKSFVQTVKIPATTKANHGYMHSWIEPKASTLKELEAIGKDDNFGTDPEFVRKSFLFLPNANTRVSGEHVPMCLQVQGTDGNIRTISLFGTGILDAVENTVQQYIYNKRYSEAKLDEVQLMVKQWSDEAFNRVNLVIHKGFISKDVTDNRGMALNGEKLELRVFNFLLNTDEMAKVAKHPEANDMLKALVRVRTALTAAPTYAADVVRKAAEIGMADENNPSFNGNMNRHRNWIMRNRGTTFDLREGQGKAGTKTLSEKTQAFFKLDTSGNETQVGDWNWRNAPMGNGYNRSIGKSADLQFIHEEYGDKIVATLRVVARGNEDNRTEDGKAIEVKAHLDRAFGTAIETYINPTIDPAWRDAITEEMDLRMRVLGARRYSADSENVSGTPMAVIGGGRPREAKRKIDETAPTEPQATPKVDTAPKEVAFERQNLNNGTMFTSTEGYFIAVINNKFRLYGANKALVGVYASENEARRKANALARKGKKQ